MSGTGVYAIDDDFDEAGYTNPLPTAEDDGLDPHVAVVKVARLDSKAQVSAVDDCPTICYCFRYTQTPWNPSTSCGSSSGSNASTKHARADAHRRPLPPSPHPSPDFVSPPSYHHLLALAVRANAGLTLGNPSLSRGIHPLSYSVLTPVWVGLG